MKKKYKHLLIISGVGIESRQDKNIDTNDTNDTSDVSCLNGSILDLWSIGAQADSYHIDVYDETQGEVDITVSQPVATFTSKEIYQVQSADNFDLENTPRYGFVSVSKGVIGHLAFETNSKFDIQKLKSFATEFEKDEFVIDRFSYTGWQEESIGVVLSDSNDDLMAIQNDFYMDLREISYHKILEF